MTAKICTVLLRRSICLMLLGMACIVISIFYYIRVRDRLLLILSAALLVASLWRAAKLLRICWSGDYKVVDGVCTKTRAIRFTRQKHVEITSESGGVYLFRLNRQIRLRLGGRYRLYLRNSECAVSLGLESVDYLLSADTFLGYERI